MPRSVFNGLCFNDLCRCPSGLFIKNNVTWGSVLEEKPFYCNLNQLHISGEAMKEKWACIIFHEWSFSIFIISQNINSFLQSICHCKRCEQWSLKIPNGTRYGHLIDDSLRKASHILYYIKNGENISNIWCWRKLVLQWYNTHHNK